MERTLELWGGITEMFHVSNESPLTMSTRPTYAEEEEVQVQATLIEPMPGEFGYLLTYRGRRYFVFPSQAVLVNA